MIFQHKNLSILVGISSIFVCLIPFALLTGPFIPDLLLSLTVLLTCFEIIRKKKYSYFKNNYFYLFSIFYFYILSRSIFSEFSLFSTESSFFYFRFVLFSIAVWYLLDENKRLLKSFTIVFLITFIIALFDGYFQFFNDSNLFGIVSPSERMNLLLNDKLILGGYLSRLFPFLIGLILLNLNYSFLNVLLFSFLLISTDILVYVTGERTALGLLFLSTVFILVFISKYKFVRLITIIVSISAIIIISFFNDDVKRRNIDQTFNQIGISENSSQIYMFSPIHQSHFISAYRMFSDNPIFGHGPKTFRILCSHKDYNYDVNSCSTHPHNTYVQLLAETGLVGVMFVLLALFYLLITMIKHINYFFLKKELLLSDYQICLIACFIITLWPIAPTNNFFNNWISIVYYLPIGFYLHSIYSMNNNDQRYNN